MARLSPFVLAPLLAACASLGSPSPAVQDRPAGAPNTRYPGNRAPLAELPLVRLPVGAVRPAGWLRRQLQLQDQGFHGHLGELSKFLRKERNAWLSPTGEGDHGWEEVPYWLKGYGDCAYLLGSDEHVREARTWIEGALQSQRADGYFGPASAKSTVSSTAGKYDLWPNMVMLACLMSWHELTGDERVLALMQRYYRWQLTVPDDDFLPPYWQQQRGGDNLWAVHWLYARTGEPFLLELASKIHRRTANWTDGVPDWHNVNMAQAFGSATFFARQSRAEQHWAAAERNWRAIRDAFGQVPGGMFGGDENCRVGFTGPRQAIETCGMVEMMYSCERLLQVTGDPVWADRCEDVAFNSLPAALTADLKALRYLTAPNQPLSDAGSKAPGVENGGAMFLMDPWQHRCCQHNFGHGWPYFVEHLWMGAPDDGLAAVLYGPCEVDAEVAGGVRVRVVETTQYPFRDRIAIDVTPASDVSFPLLLRVPGWCRAPALAVDGAAVAVAARPSSWLRLDRQWPARTTRVELVLPMPVTVRRWTRSFDSVSIDRGPLTYSLAIPERAVRAGGTDAWPATSLEPTAPWNYGLELPGDPAALEVIERPWPANDEPWTLAASPVELRARGARIERWQLDPTGLVQELQPSPIRSTAPCETLRLVPMGLARLRISAFPVLGEHGAEWRQPPEAWAWTPSASHCFRHDTLEALRDGAVPPVPAPRNFPRFSWWDHRGTAETVQYDFPAPRRVARVSVYWFDDQPSGGCAVPASWFVVVKDGDAWKPVSARGPYGTGKDAFQTVKLEPVTTTAVRLVVQLQDGKSAGIYELRVE